MAGIQQISKANKPRKGSTLTRNGRPRLGTISETKLTEMMEKNPSKKAKDKIRSRLNVLAKRAKKATHQST